MSPQNKFDDVYRCLIEVLYRSIRQALRKDQADLITKQPALAAVLAKALQGYVAIAEEEMADEQLPQPDRLGRPHLVPRATLIRNMGWNDEALEDVLRNCHKLSGSKIIHALHVSRPAEDHSAMVLSNFMLQACNHLHSSNKPLAGLMKRLGVMEAAVRCVRQQTAILRLAYGLSSVWLREFCVLIAVRCQW